MRKNSKARSSTVRRFDLVFELSGPKHEPRLAGCGNTPQHKRSFCAYVALRFDEFLCVVTLACAPRDFCVRIFCHLPHVVGHDLGRFALGMPLSACQARVDDQAISIGGQRVALVTQFAGRIALAIEPCLGIGLGLMRLRLYCTCSIS